MISLCVERNNFLEKIKFQEDKEKLKLIQIQKQLEEKMTIELATKLIKDLKREERSKLLELYKTQINELETSLENYKRRILRIRNN